MDGGSRLRDLRRFYELLENLESRLGGARNLRECTGREGWPARGVYFFFEKGELRDHTGQGQRVVRVGTHALKSGSRTKIWTRLSQHKGVQKTGGGNHRGSIFRLIVGSALAGRDGLNYPTWGKGSSAPRETRNGEIDLERAVSKEIGTMPFLWLEIDDEPQPESLRGYIERNSIALLSNFDKKPLDPAADNWLGSFSDRKLVRGSGLWNSRHVNDSYRRDFLDTFEKLILGVTKKS